MVVEKNIGANLLAKDRELKNLNELVSWDGYEDWRWDPTINNEA